MEAHAEHHQNTNNHPSSPPSESSRSLSQMDSSASPNRYDRDRDPLNAYYQQQQQEEEFLTPETTQRSKRRSTTGAAAPGAAAPGAAAPGAAAPGAAAPGTDAPDQQTNKRTLAPRSTVSDHFTRMENNRDRCICTYCRKDYACATKSGTTNLRNHLKSCKEYKAWVDGKSGSQSQQVINREGNLMSAKVTFEVFRQAANEMLIIGELPLSFIESDAFKHFCDKCMLPTPVSRRTSKRDIIEMYVQRKAAMRQWFMANKQRVSLTTDIWVSQVTGDSYMVITAHYVDASWRLKKMIIGFKYVTDHRGKTIANALLECLAEWGITKVFCVTVDNATANSNALRRFESEFSLLSNDSILMKGEFLHLRCAAHIINLIVKDGMADVDSSVTAIRNGISYIRSGTNRLKAFELKVDAGRMTRGSLPLDVKTRWNSTLLMLTKAHAFKAAFDKMELEDKLYTDHFNEFENGEKRVGPPGFFDWQAVDRLMKFLNLFYKATLVVSASTSVNSHKCYGQIVNIATNLTILSNSFDSVLKKKAAEMFKKFDKYWDGLKNINKMLVVASVFDPRKKMQFAKMCFEELYGENSAEAKASYDTILGLLRDMFNDYSSRYGNRSEGEQSQSQSRSTLSSQSTQEQQIDPMDFVVDDIGIKNIESMYNTKLKEIGVKESRNELDVYLKEDVVNPGLIMGSDYDVLSWWKLNCGKFPILSHMARDLFAMQVSSVASESAFSTSGRIINPFRSCLTPDMVEVLMCTEQWLKQDLNLESRILTNSEIFAEVQFEDNLVKEFDNPNEEV